MIENKIKVKFPSVDLEEFKFNNEKFLVEPYLSINDKTILIETYLDNLYSDFSLDISQRYVIAEYALKISILERKTNIEVDVADFDLLLNSGLWSIVVSKISNYNEFMFELREAVKFTEEQKRLENSVGFIVQGFFDKLSEILEKIPDTKIEDFKSTTESFIGELNKLNKVSPGILTEKTSPKKKKEQIL